MWERKNGEKRQNIYSVKLGFLPGQLLFSLNGAKLARQKP